MFKFFIKQNNVKKACDECGEVLKDENGAEVILTDEQASSATEVTAVDSEVKALRDFIKTTATAEAQKAVEALDLVNSFGAEAKTAFVDAIKNAGTKKDMLNLDSIKTGFAEVKSAGGKSFEFAVKTLSELNSLTGDVVEPQRDTEIYRDPVRIPLIEDLASTSSTTSNKITWTEVTTETGAPATTAELATFAEKDYEFAVFEAPILKVTVMSKHSTEILEDMPALVAEVKKMLQTDLNLKVDEKLLLGAGTAGEFNGVYTQATAFSAGSVVVDEPNEFDVLRVAMANIATAGKGTYRPTAILMTPIDSAKLDLKKGTDGHYVMPPFSTADRTVIKGVRIVENTLMSAGTFLVGDFSKLTVRNKRGFTIQVATENGTDFEKDILTIRASRRLGSYIKGNDNGAFVKGTFSTAITDLTS